MNWDFTFIKNNRLFFSIGAVIIAILLYFPIFYNLDTLMIHPWDEGLFAIRAYYFAKYGEAIHNFNQLGLSKLGNTKPAFFTIIQAFFMKIFGYESLALRLPVAICYFILCCHLLWYSLRKFKNLFIGILAVLILLTTPAMLDHHIARFGDQDIPFTLFLWLCFVNIERYFEEKKILNLASSLLFFFMAYYTKSISAFLIFPGIFLFILFGKKLLTNLKDYKIWLYSFALFIPLISSFIFKARHINNAKRLISASQHKGDFSYYFSYMIHDGLLIPWILLLPIALFFLKKYPSLKLYLLQFITIFLILSLAKTKLYWYIAPVLPYYAISCAIVLNEIISALALSFAKKDKEKIFLVGAVFAIFYYPYILRIKEVTHLKEEYIINQSLRVLKDAKSELTSNDTLTIIYEDVYMPQLEYYQLIYKKEYHLNVEVKAAKDISFSQPGFYISYNDSINKMLKKQNNTSQINNYSHAYLYEVK